MKIVEEVDKGNASLTIHFKSLVNNTFPSKFHASETQATLAKTNSDDDLNTASHFANHKRDSILQGFLCEENTAGEPLLWLFQFTDLKLLLNS